MALSEAQIQRYSRHILLPEIGGRGQEKLLACGVRVTLCDESPAAAHSLEYLAAAGVGHIELHAEVPRTVSRHDLHRHLALHPEDLGCDLLDALRERLGERYPDLSFEKDAQEALELAPFLAEAEDLVLPASPHASLHRGCIAATHLLERVLRS